MNRWRDTLCGSAIKPAGLAHQNAQESLSAESQVLSCGGVFVPKGENETPLRKKKKSLFMLHLAKDDYEVIFQDNDDSWVRCGDISLEPADDTEAFEQEYESLQPKSMK